MKTLPSLVFFAAAILVAPGCRRHSAPTPADFAPARRQLHPPHGGTPVVLGAELYHLELVRDAATGTLSAYLLDGEMEEFIRSPAPAITIDARVNGEIRRVVLAAVANSATGETVGDTALFQGQAQWLKTAAQFDATLESIAIRGAEFSAVKFNFPAGNELE